MGATQGFHLPPRATREETEAPAGASVPAVGTALLGIVLGCQEESLVLHLAPGGFRGSRLSHTCCRPCTPEPRAALSPDSTVNLD